MKFLPILVLYLTPTLTWACSCNIGSLKQRYDRAGSVFIAEVGPNYDFMAERLKLKDIVVDHTVLRVFKGTPKEQLMTTNSSCATGYAADTKFLVFQPPEHPDHMCSGTIKLEEAMEENYVWALERFVSRETKSLVEPWVGKKTASWHKRRRHFGCSFSIPLDGALPNLATGSLRAGASYDKKTQVHQPIIWVLTVPSSYKKMDRQEPTLTIDGRIIDLLDSGRSKTRIHSMTYSIVGSDGADIVRQLMASTSEVSVGPFEVNSSNVSDETFEALWQLPKQQMIEVPMSNLGSAADDFLSCVAELQDLDFLGR